VVPDQAGLPQGSGYPVDILLWV